MENVRFFKYWYFKEHFSSQGNKVTMTGLGKSKMANSILSSWGNNISMEVWGRSWNTSTTSFQQNLVNFNHWWQYCIHSLDLISAEGMSSTSCKYLQAFCRCTDFAKSLENAACLRVHPMVIYSCIKTGSFHSPTGAGKLGCKIDYTFKRDLKVAKLLKTQDIDVKWWLENLLSLNNAI